MTTAHDSDWTGKPVIPKIPRPRPPQEPHRRLAAVGMIRRSHGRTLHVTATPTGATGRITPGGAR